MEQIILEKIKSNGSFRYKVVCLICKKYFFTGHYKLSKGKGKFCSQICYRKYTKGLLVGYKNPNWNGGRQQHGENSYIRIFSPHHPRASKRNYVYEHILVMEKHLGRYLKKGETVHHINRIKYDNQIKNLLICENDKEHRRYDNGWWKVDEKWWKKCTKCKKEMEVNENNFYKHKSDSSTAEWFPKCKYCVRFESKKRKRKKYNQKND